MKIEYPYTMEPQEGGGYFVQFVDFEEAFTEGATPEEAAFNAAEVLSGIIGYRLGKGQELPAPSATGGENIRYAAPSAAIQSAMLVHLAREEQHRSLADLARALGTSWPAVARLENPHHWPSLRQLERAAAVLGKRLILSLE
uniref:Type II toxin-antitoxin system HicB family antitoxin n=1 Tax=Geobacter metallireducens TaxID=28232 RepID=A0A831XEW1_GEOME